MIRAVLDTNVLASGFIRNHPEDDLIMATAISAAAHYLVTGDTQLQASGSLIVRLSGLVDHLGKMGRPTQRLLPVGSAVMVTVLGTVMSAKAVLAYLTW